MYPYTQLAEQDAMYFSLAVLRAVLDYFLTLFPYNGPYIRVGYDSEIQAKGIGRIDLEDGLFLI